MVMMMMMMMMMMVPRTQATVINIVAILFPQTTNNVPSVSSLFSCSHFISSVLLFSLHLELKAPPPSSLFVFCFWGEVPHPVCMVLCVCVCVSV